MLDFGHVVIDTVVSQVCQLTNVGHFPISCMADQRKLANTGFYVDLDRVQGLPGSPDNEFIEFTVVFNPALANLTLGPVETVMPIKVKMITHIQSNRSDTLLSLCAVALISFNKRSFITFQSFRF